MEKSLIEKVAEIHNRICKDSADNFERLQRKFRYAHAYWIDADASRRIQDRQRRAGGTVVVTNERGTELGGQKLADALERGGGEMLVFVWIERAQDATLMELAIR